jgi:16S rRNA processing protein RimM
MDRARVVVAEVLRPRGNRGELLIRSQTDVPGRFERLKRAQARLVDGRDVPVEIERVWAHDGAWVLKLAGVNAIGDAERFRGADLWVPVEARGELPQGEFFESDLIGCVVVDAARGTELGRVEGWQACGGPPLMQVRVDAREVLIPFVPAICREVNLEARRICVELPDGLLDL